MAPGTPKYVLLPFFLFLIPSVPKVLVRRKDFDFTLLTSIVLTIFRWGEGLKFRIFREGSRVAGFWPERCLTRFQGTKHQKWNRGCRFLIFFFSFLEKFVNNKKNFRIWG